MSKPGYGIIVYYKNGKTLKQVVANNPHTRNRVIKLWLKKPDVDKVEKYTEKDYLP